LDSQQQAPRLRQNGCTRSHPTPALLPARNQRALFFACTRADILKDQWSPALTLKTALLSLQALLASPQPDDPQDAVVANQYRSEFATFEKTAKYWTEAFANSEGDEEKIAKIVDMGFDRSAAMRALQAAGGDENAALEALLGS
jgi:ubiquitin-conjugating enzyme (huntingtin interacting protein 2)